MEDLILQRVVDEYDKPYVSFQAEMNLVPITGKLMAKPMKRQVIRLLDNATEELKYFVETGNVHPRKQKLIAKTLEAESTD